MEVPSDIKWDDSHVQGRLSLCQAIRERIQHSQGLKKNEVCLVGIYGVGGIGKTTICKTLCNELSQEFEGKVSHVELGSRTPGELLKGVLEDLTDTSRELLQQLGEDKCKHILRIGMRKQRTFLAIDNVWDVSQTLEAARMFIQAQFHEESVVMVTSRSLKTLTGLGINQSYCLEMPKLGDEDAKRLFLYHAAFDKHFFTYEDERAIKECVALCYFSKGDKEGGHYLPLALKALGVQLGCTGQKPSRWLKTLPKVRDFNYLEEEYNPVFSILRSSYDRIQPNDQCLFMDVVMLAPSTHSRYKLDLTEWLSYVYNEDLKEIESRLRRLKDRVLLEDVNLASQTIRVHDVYREFARLESQGKLDKAQSFKKRRWAWYEDAYPTELEMTPFHGCWQNLTRIGIVTKTWFSGEDGRSLKGSGWRYCSNVVVLKLVKLKNLRGGLNLDALRCLRSLELFDVGSLDSLDGLQELNNLNFFRWIQHEWFCHVYARMGQLPSSLKRLQLEVRVWLKADVFAHCTNLSKLELMSCKAETLDFSGCSSLHSVKLDTLVSLRSLSGLTAATVSSLQVLHCHGLVEIPGLGHLVGLQLLDLCTNTSFEILPDLQKLTRLQTLYINSMNIRGLPCQRGSIVDLPALQYLNLGYCKGLSRLPDLSKLRNLEELGLGCSAVEFHEEDICMLAALPLLRPVVVGFGNYEYFRLDVVKRKVLKWVATSREQYPTESWLSWTKWEERDLGMLPIKNKDICGW